MMCKASLIDQCAKKNDDDDPKRGKDIVLQETTRTQAHRWVLFHTEAVAPFLEYVLKLT